MRNAVFKLSGACLSFLQFVRQKQDLLLKTHLLLGMQFLGSRKGLVRLLEFGVQRDHFLLPRAARGQQGVVIMVEIKKKRVFLLSLGAARHTFSTDVPDEVTIVTRC